MLERFITIAEDSTSELIEKKSRFLTYVYQIQSIEQADAYLEQIRKKHWDARHHCYAYQLGERNEIQRFSDDGEPQGTAGKPILDVLKGPDIKNTLIIVVRYFGGTLLGTGGLVRAYGHSAKQGIISSGLVEKCLVTLYHLDMSYPLSGKVQYLLNEAQYTIRETDYSHLVTFVVEVLASDCDQFETWITDQTNAEISFQKGESVRITRALA